MHRTPEVLACEQWAARLRAVLDALPTMPAAEAANALRELEGAKRAVPAPLRALIDAAAFEATRRETPGGGMTYEELGGRLGLKLEGVRGLVNRARARFGEDDGRLTQQGMQGVDNRWLGGAESMRQRG
jgi:hypothetical protein